MYLAVQNFLKYLTLIVFGENSAKAFEWLQGAIYCWVL